MFILSPAGFEIPTIEQSEEREREREIERGKGRAGVSGKLQVSDKSRETSERNLKPSSTTTSTETANAVIVKICQD